MSRICASRAYIPGKKQIKVGEGESIPRLERPEFMLEEPRPEDPELLLSLLEGYSLRPLPLFMLLPELPPKPPSEELMLLLPCWRLEELFPTEPES
jgi:hypothetical protein